MRADLSFVETHHTHESAVVVKDPIAMKYHRLRPDEFFVLQQLDGKVSLEEIRSRYEQRFAPLRVTPAQLNQLLFRFHKSGLTISDALLQGDQLVVRRSEERRQRMKQHLSGILFIRFPGIDPEPLLRRIYPLVQPLLGLFGAAAAVLLCCSALFLFVANWGQFTAELPAMAQWLRMDSILLLIMVISGTKILHELGHAIVCKHFGGECHQIGPMLLVFAPALYCDTSDSWMLPNRFQRAAVGLAGIGTEVILASIATFIWVSTGPGLTHSIAMNVMLVCSVSTLLFNANPLLRYDGYYVLSDLCDVPNLGETSRRALSTRLAKLLFGVDESTPETESGSGWLLLYAVLATVYRWGLTLMILWVVSLMLRPYRLESLGRLLCVIAAAGLIAMTLRAPLQFLRNPARRRLLRMNRLFASAVAATLLLVVLLWPLPSGVSASGRIVPSSETPIYISTAGRLDALIVAPGNMVQQGDEIARLTNHDVHLSYLQAKGRFETQQRLVESIKRSRYENPDAANELPAAEALLVELSKQLSKRQRRYEGLVLKSPSSGRLVAVARRPQADRSPSPQQEYRLVGWSGFPTDQENDKCFLESGTELMSVVSDDQWNAELILSQSQVQRIDLGDAVKLVLESNPATTFTGTVGEISRAQWTAEQNAQRQDDPNAVRKDRPLATSYVVRVDLPAAQIPMINGATVSARITADNISVLGRARRSLSRLFRFR
jgi:putative peptide zinc metalloprotease protein